MQHGYFSPLAKELHEASLVWSTPGRSDNEEQHVRIHLIYNKHVRIHTNTNKYTYYSHGSNSQCTVVQWENPLAVQYPSATLSHLHTTGVLI